jgi:hypothetical protein
MLCTAAATGAGAPSLVTSVNATRLQVNQATTMRIRALNFPPPAPPLPGNPANASRTATVTVTPAGIVRCSPVSPRFAVNNVATANCIGLKVGVANVLVSYAGVNTTRVLRVV